MHVVVGAGPVGSATARLLAGQGQRVRLITPGSRNDRRRTGGHRQPLWVRRCRRSDDRGDAALRLAGLFGPDARETQHQWQRPFVVDSTAATVAFGIKPTPTDDALRK